MTTHVNRTAAAIRNLLGVMLAELRSLNRARMPPHELRVLSRAEQAARVKAHLAEHHARRARCC